MSKMLPPNTGIWYVDTLALTTPTAPKLSEITTALAAIVSPRMVNISAAIGAGYKLGALKSDVIKSKGIVDTGNYDARGAGNYDCSLPLFQEALPAVNTTSDYLVATGLLAQKNIFCTMMKRLGKPYTSPLVIGDVVSLFSIVTDNPVILEGNVGDPVTLTIVGGKQGFIAQNVVIVA